MIYMAIVLLAIGCIVLTYFLDKCFREINRLDKRTVLHIKRIHRLEKEINKLKQKA